MKYPTVSGWVTSNHMESELCWRSTMAILLHAFYCRHITITASDGVVVALWPLYCSVYIFAVGGWFVRCLRPWSGQSGRLYSVLSQCERNSDGVIYVPGQR